MEKLLAIFLSIFLALVALVSCYKNEEPVVENEEIQAYLSQEKTLKQAMKRTLRDTRRLAKAVESKDWIEIEMWANELKQGIGVSCVNLYIKNHPGVSGEFIIFSDRFYNATNRLILSCKKHDADTAEIQFEKMLNTCEICHERYKKKDKNHDGG